MIRINNSKYLKNITRFIRQILYKNLAVGVEIIHRGKTQLVSVALGRQEADFVTENGGPIVLDENKGFIGQLLVTEVAFEAIEICEKEFWIIHVKKNFHRRLYLKKKSKLLNYRFTSIKFLVFNFIFIPILFNLFCFIYLFWKMQHCPSVSYHLNILYLTTSTCTVSSVK